MSEIYSFYAMMSRIKYIHRWGLMKNTRNENLSEHSLEVSMIAHALGVINNKRFDGSINPERLAVLAMFHDVSEIITGDLPTPVKYDNRKITNASKELEEQARLSRGIQKYTLRGRKRASSLEVRKGCRHHIRTYKMHGGTHYG